MGQDLFWQSKFFNQVKEKVSSHISVVDEIAEVLKVSNDSAYRRMRGETALSLDEAILLANHFSISMEDVFGSAADSVLLQRVRIDPDEKSLIGYLEKTKNIFQAFRELEEPQGIYSAKDIPVFYYFQYPELAKFKLFFWIKTLKENESMQGKDFSPDEIPASVFKLCESISGDYCAIPFTEIWNDQTINSILRQIDYYRESGFFSSKNDGIILCDQLSELIQMIRKQAEAGKRWNKAKEVFTEIPYHLYYNELMIPEEVISVSSKNSGFTLLTYHAMDYFYSYQRKFSEEINAGLTIQLKKSVPMSNTGEKERNRFFKRMLERVAELRTKFN